MPNPDLFIIDAIGPFFLGYEKRVVNWSKIPFVNLESGNRLDPLKLGPIREAFIQFIDRIVEEGFNAISIDDVAHLVSFSFYPQELRQKLAEYKGFYRDLLKEVADRGVRIFVNSDIMFYNEFIQKAIGTNVGRATELLTDAFVKLFADYPVDGVILRIGETDGKDVLGDFKSRLLLKTPSVTNRFIKSVLPVFEHYNKLLVFRTWTVGSYPIGDLIWNKETFKKAFSDIYSPSFIISMKYGDTDFFSALDLNPLFYQFNDRQIILELQTRRERELFGNLPFYVGWDYAAYQRQVAGMKDLVGISVWCQTGGWSRNNSLTFLENGSEWNELNTVATLRIFKYQEDPDSILDSFMNNPDRAEFLRQFHRLLFRILYIRGFTAKKLFFRRTRVPPLFWLAWDYITINPLINALYQAFNDQSIDVTETDIETVRELGRRAGINRINFYCDTLLLFLRCVHTITGEQPAVSLTGAIDAYRATYSDCNLKFKLNDVERTNTQAVKLLPLLIRNGAGYRLIDRIMLNPLISWIQLKLVNHVSRDQLPKYANKRAMEAETLFK